MARRAYSAVRESIVGYLDKHIQFMRRRDRLSINRAEVERVGSQARGTARADVKERARQRRMRCAVPAVSDILFA